MKNLIFILFILPIIAFAGEPDVKVIDKSKLPSKVVVKGVCIDLTTTIAPNGVDRTHSVTCEGTAGVCVTYSGGNIETHNCPPGDVTVTSITPPQLEQVGNNKKVTFSGR